MRLFKELVFHNGLLEHQLFSENPPKMDFFLFRKDFSKKFFSQPLGCQTWFYLFLKLLMGTFSMSTNIELQLIKISNFITVKT